MENESILNTIIIPAFIQDIILSLYKKEKLKNYPKSLLSYIDKIDKEKALIDIKSYINLNSGTIYETSKNFAIKELPFLIDNWFNDKKFKDKNGKLFNELELFFKESTFEEVSEKLSQELNDSIIVVQTPIILDNKNRLKYRKKISQKHPSSFVEFVVNPNLIGGLRILENEKVIDYSWSNLVSSFKIK